MSTTVGRETEGEVDDEAEFGEGRLGLRLMVRVMFWATFRSRKANESAFFSRHTSVNARLLTARGTLKYPIPANMSTTTSPAAICLAKCMRSVPFPDANITRDTSSEYLMPPSTCVVSQDPVLFLSPLALPSRSSFSWPRAQITPKLSGVLNSPDTLAANPTTRTPSASPKALPMRRAALGREVTRVPSKPGRISTSPTFSHLLGNACRMCSSSHLFSSSLSASSSTLSHTLCQGPTLGFRFVLGCDEKAAIQKRQQNKKNLK